MAGIMGHWLYPQGSRSAGPMWDGEVVDRGTILPLGTYDDGSTGLAWPSILYDPAVSAKRLWDNAGAAADPALSQDMAPGIGHDVFNVAGSVGLGGVAVPKPAGVGAREALVPNGHKSGVGGLSPNRPTARSAPRINFEAPRYYHGTRADAFDEFGTERPLFLASHADQANEYAGTSGHVYPATIEENTRLFDARNAEDKDLLHQAIADGTLKLEPHDARPLSSSNANLVSMALHNSNIDHPVYQWMRKAGYGGFKGWEHPSGEHVGLIAPNTARSATTGEVIFSNDSRSSLPYLLSQAADENAARVPFRDRLSAGDTRVGAIDGKSVVRNWNPDTGALKYNILDEAGNATGYANVAVDDRTMNWVSAPGMGSKLYDLIGDDMGAPLRPSQESLTDSAFAFWSKRDPGQLLHSYAGNSGSYPEAKRRIIEELRKRGASDYDIEKKLGVPLNIPQSIGPMREEMRKVQELFGPKEDTPGELDSSNLYPKGMTPVPEIAISGKSANLLAANGRNSSLPYLTGQALDNRAASALLDEGPKGFTAYHGSPHDFDKFDMSKIGTGEGAQAYGHGLYFAESEGVAQSYRDGLSPGSFAIDGASVQQTAMPWLKEYMTRDDKSLASVLTRINNGISSRESRRSSLAKEKGNKTAAHIGESLKKEIEIERNRADALRSYLNEKQDANAGWNSNGHMYEVRINADPNDFLDWDKPLSQQSDGVRQKYLNALGAMGHQNPQSIMESPFATSGQGLENLLNAWSRYDRGKASSALNEAGIPGIKYLDQGSRTAGEGSRNYVLFRDDIIDIVKKYGIAAAALMYGEQAVQSAMDSGASVQTDY